MKFEAVIRQTVIYEGRFEFEADTIEEAAARAVELSTNADATRVDDGELVDAHVVELVEL